MNLYPHQQLALEFLQKNKKAIIPLPPGLGKTRVALVNAIGKKSLIIVPSFLKLNWQKEIDLFPVNTFHNIKIISYYEAVKNLSVLLNESFEYIVLDEAHYIKNVSAKRTEACVKIIRNNLSSYVALLTGTPIKSRVSELWSLLFAVASIRFPFLIKYHPFCNEYSFRIEKYFGGKKVISYSGIKNEVKLRELIAPVFFHIDADKLLQLPDRIVKRIHLDVKTDGLLKEVDLDRPDDFSTVKMENAKSKAISGSEYISDLFSQVGKLVVFSDHPDAVKEIRDLLLKETPNCYLITGATQVGSRQEMVDKFNASSEAVMLCTIGAASVGLNLQTANHCVFIDYPWVPGDLEQAEKRIRRIGQNKTCIYHYLLSGKIDEMILKTVESKMIVIGKVNGTL